MVSYHSKVNILLTLYSHNLNLDFFFRGVFSLVTLFLTHSYHFSGIVVNFSLTPNSPSLISSCFFHSFAAILECYTDWLQSARRLPCTALPEGFPEEQYPSYRIFNMPAQMLRLGLLPSPFMPLHQNPVSELSFPPSKMLEFSTLFQ